MTKKELITHLAKFEGKKHEASVGDIRELIKILTELCATRSEAYLLLLDLIQAKRKAK